MDRHQDTRSTAWRHQGSRKRPSRQPGRHKEPRVKARLYYPFSVFWATWEAGKGDLDSPGGTKRHLSRKNFTTHLGSNPWGLG